MAVLDSLALHPRTLPYVRPEPRSRMNAKIKYVARLKYRGELPMLHDSSWQRSPRRGARRTV